MKRSEFYREYYKITNRMFADHTVWSAKDRENAWRKGQINTSKTQRKIFIAVQYLILFSAVLTFLLGLNGYGIIGFVSFFLICLITDYSVIKIEVLYYIYNRNTIYSALLYQSFLGKSDELWQLVKTRTTKQVSGFVRLNRNKLNVKYRVIYRKNHQNIMIQLTPSSIIIKAESLNVRFRNSALTLSELAEGIANALNSISKQSSTL